MTFAALVARRELRPLATREEMNLRPRFAAVALAAGCVTACNTDPAGDPTSTSPIGMDAGRTQVDTGSVLGDAGSSVEVGSNGGQNPGARRDAQSPGMDPSISPAARDAAVGSDSAFPLDAASNSQGQGEAGQSEAGSAIANCPARSGLAAGESSASLQFGGVTRTYRVYVPNGYKADAPAALVLWFHGILGSSQDYRSSGFREVADREGFILVAPEGIDTAWNIGPCCTARRRNVDDVGFAKAVVGELKAKVCIDSARVYAAGFSMGGGLTHYLACHAADVFAAAAPSAFDLLKENVDDCKPVRAIPVASFRNSFDTFVYYDGVSDSQPPNTSVTGDTSVRINILGAEATFAAWAKIDGCSGAPEDDGADCKTYKQCRDGAEVTLCTEYDPIGGHHPGPADQMWAHLKRYRLR